MIECFLCGSAEDVDLDLDWCETLAEMLHVECLQEFFRHRTWYDPVWRKIAVEFGMQGSAPGRKAIECREGHPYSPANTYVDRRGNQQCRICKSRHARAQYAKNAQRYQEARDRCGKHVAVVVGPELRGAVMVAAFACGESVSAWVRRQIKERLPEWEARYAPDQEAQRGAEQQAG